MEWAFHRGFHPGWYAFAHLNSTVGPGFPGVRHGQASAVIWTGVSRTGRMFLREAPTGSDNSRRGPSPDQVGQQEPVPSTPRDLMRTRMTRRGITFLPCVPLLTATLAAADWPQFRGPDGQGHAEATDLPVTWSESENVTWKTAIPGKGWSSPVVEDDQIWMTSSIASPISEEERARRLEGNTNNQPLSMSGPVSLRAVCVDRASGRLLHDIEVLTEEQPDAIHALNSFASPTPVLENGRLYCHYGANGTACLDTRSREILWRNKDQRIRHENGAGGSPLLWKDRLIFDCDGSDAQYIVALDSRTGEVAWRTPRSGRLHTNPQLKKAYGTPVVIDAGGTPWLISTGANWVYGYDPADGEELWRLEYGVLGFSIVPRPVVGHGMFYISTCFVRSELLAVRYRETGEIIEPRIAWRHGSGVPKMSSPLLVGKELYFVSDRGILTCLDALTGKERYRERLGGNFCSSPLLADGRIYLGNREGSMTVLRPGPTLEKLAVNRLDGAIMASPIALDTALYIRTEESLYRIEKSSR